MIRNVYLTMLSLIQSTVNNRHDRQLWQLLYYIRTGVWPSTRNKGVRFLFLGQNYFHRRVVPHEFLTFHAKRSPPLPCFRSKPTSIIVQFHMSFRFSTWNEVHPIPSLRGKTIYHCPIFNFPRITTLRDKIIKFSI